MPVKKGQVLNPKGRGKGIPNVTTKKTRELLTDFMDEKFPEVCLAWGKLGNLQKVKTYTQLLKYVMPTLTSVKVEDNTNEQDEILKKILENQV